MPTLDGRTVLVTGASTGIGRATALMLAELGATVYAGTRDAASGYALGPTVRPVALDVTNDVDILDVAAQIERLDGLVNNAGIAVTSPLEYLPLGELRRQLEVNAIAALAVTQACLPALRRARGRIVNISSISGRWVVPLYGPYAASKYALEALSDALRRELRGSGVHVSVIEPGAIATPIWERGTATADGLFAAMPPIAHERYGQLVATLRAEAIKQPEKGAPPEAVARVIVAALTARRPRARYLVGRDAKVQAALAHVLPARAMDALLFAALRTRR
jgi:NAD(P)-dependent dehydrogenase (short-subunit alcohol dehydrogenase family)